MGSYYQNRVRSSYKSVKCYRVEGGRYGPMIRFYFMLIKTSQLATFGLWNHVASTLQTCGWYPMSGHTTS